MLARIAISATTFLTVLAGSLAAAPNSAAAGEDISHGSLRVVHEGQGVFSVAVPVEMRTAESGAGPAHIDLKRVQHGYDPDVDGDVPVYTNVTLNDRVPSLVDSFGRAYAVITLYQVDPPLADLPSRDPGVDRGIDMRSPAEMVKSAYSNYVSPVVTNDAEGHPVPSHPIGHFFVKVEISGYPTLLTGMTTIARADQEMVDLTLDRQLGIGGVLLTPQPGRLNSAEEAIDELSLRQRQLRVIDGVLYKKPGRKNVGPEYIVDDGNVVFARFRVPPQNAKDALAVFVEFIWRGEHRIFGSLINRPHKGTGAGCTPFAMAWLKASGIIPFVTEPPDSRLVDDMSRGPMGAADFWQDLLRTAYIPWDHIGCDERVGASQPVSANYTVFDHLFHKERTLHLLRAIPGLAEKIKEDQGVVVATLFAFGALTPLRDLVIAAKRKDPKGVGNYEWTENGQGLKAQFWDNGRFSDWIKHLWTGAPPPDGIRLVEEGRFLGIEVDAMDTPRQREPFFAEAERIRRSAERLEAETYDATSCSSIFQLGLQ